MQAIVGVKNKMPNRVGVFPTKWSKRLQKHAHQLSKKLADQTTFIFS
jgi:DNA-binding sugar fermentation-stimulating protein